MDQVSRSFNPPCLVDQVNLSPRVFWPSLPPSQVDLKDRFVTLCKAARRDFVGSRDKSFTPRVQELTMEMYRMYKGLAEEGEEEEEEEEHEE